MLQRSENFEFHFFLFAIIICGYPFLYLAIISPVVFNVVFLNIYTV